MNKKIKKLAKSKKKIIISKSHICLFSKIGLIVLISGEKKTMLKFPSVQFVKEKALRFLKAFPIVYEPNKPQIYHGKYHNKTLETFINHNIMQ